VDAVAAEQGGRHEQREHGSGGDEPPLSHGDEAKTSRPAPRCRTHRRARPPARGRAGRAS
jgi:hypothetical protein